MVAHYKRYLLVKGTPLGNLDKLLLLCYCESSNKIKVFPFRCDNGYFGNPLAVGDFCKPCDCKGNANPYIPNWCDHRTGDIVNQT